MYNIVLCHGMGLWFQTWECGIRLCKELSELYEKELFDYHKLAAILVFSHCTLYIAIYTYYLIRRLRQGSLGILLQN